MSNRLKLRVELADGCILVGEVISVGSKPQSPEYFDKPQMNFYLELLTDTLGKVEINAFHIVKMGPDPTKMQEFNDPVEVVDYVIELMRVAQDMPLNFLQPKG